MRGGEREGALEIETGYASGVGGGGGRKASDQLRIQTTYGKLVFGIVEWAVLKWMRTGVPADGKAVNCRVESLAGGYHSKIPVQWIPRLP